MSKSVLITGVSSGIGFYTAKTLLAEKYQVFGSLRSKNDKVVNELKEAGNFTPLFFDVQDSEAIKTNFEIVKSKIEDSQLTALINNAGWALGGPMIHLKEEELWKQIDVNVMGNFRMINQFISLLNEPQVKSTVINISSISGIFTNPFLGAYCMSKYAVEAMSDAYRRELKLYNINVVSILPGPIKSDIWDKSIGSMEPYYHTDYGNLLKSADKRIQKTAKNALPTSHISSLISKIIKSKNPKPRYIVHKQKFLTSMFFKLPDRWIDKIIWRSMKLK